MFLVKHTEHRRFANLEQRAVRHRRSALYTHRLAGQASLTKELSGRQDRQRGFLAVSGQDSKLYSSFLNVKNRGGRIALREDDFFLSMREKASASANLVKEALGIEGWRFFQPHLTYSVADAGRDYTRKVGGRWRVWRVFADFRRLRSVPNRRCRAGQSGPFAHRVFLPHCKMLRKYLDQ